MIPLSALHSSTSLSGSRPLRIIFFRRCRKEKDRVAQLVSRDGLSYQTFVMLRPLLGVRDCMASSISLLCWAMVV